MVMSYKEAIKKVKEYLNNDIGLKEENGYYTGEIYVDYGYEGVSDDYLKRIFSSVNPADTLMDIITEDEVEASTYERDALLEEIKKFFLKEGLDKEWKKYNSDIYDYLIDYVSYQYPDSYIYKEEVPTDIVIGVEDEDNYEFTLNLMEDGELLDGSIKWLIQQQGHSLEEFYDLINNPESTVDNKFLKSIREELLNCTTHIRKLAVFVKLTIEDILEYNNMMKDENVKSITISKDCNIGLIDTYNGAGGTLEIQLENDLVIPREFIYDISPDASYTYSVANTYGLCQSFWEDTNIVVNKF